MLNALALALSFNCLVVFLPHLDQALPCLLSLPLSQLLRPVPLSLPLLMTANLVLPFYLSFLPPLPDVGSVPLMGQ